MLQLIRDKAQGIIIWIIVGLVILALSSFILNSYLGSSVKDYVAKVNSQKITNDQFQRAFNNYEERLHQMLGKNFAKLFNAVTMRENVVQSLVNNALMRQMTKAAGFRTSKHRIAQVIAGYEAFQENGKFSDALYRLRLQRVGYSPEQFESDIGNSQAQQQFMDGMQDSVFVLKSSVEDFTKLQQQQRDIGYLMVNMAAIRKGIKISPAEVKDYYQSHLSDFMTDATVQVSYIDLDKKELAKSVKVTDAELQSYYQNHLASYSEPDYASAKKKIEKIAALIKKGESFAKLAKKYSQDPGSAMKGGDLGFFSRGMMVKPFDEAAFKLKVGQVSKPVRTQFGYHLIKLIAVKDHGKEIRVRHILIKPGKKTKPFSEVEAQVKQAVQLQHADKIFYQDADKLDRISYEYQDSLDPAAKKIGIKILTSPFFPRTGGSGIWHNQGIVKAAFSDDVLKSGLNSDLITINDGHMLVLRLKKYKASVQKPLAEVQQQISESLRDKQASQAAFKLANSLVKKVQAGAKPELLANKNVDVNWVNVGFIGRESKYDAKDLNKKVKIPAEIRNQVFTLAHPQTKPVVVSEKLDNGNAAVIILRAIRDNTSSVKKDELFKQTKQGLLEAESRAQKQILLEYERAHSKVDIVKQQSDQGS